MRVVKFLGVAQKYFEVAKMLGENKQFLREGWNNLLGIVNFFRISDILLTHIRYPTKVRNSSLPNIYICASVIH